VNQSKSSRRQRYKYDADQAEQEVHRCSFCACVYARVNNPTPSTSTAKPAATKAARIAGAGNKTSAASTRKNPDTSNKQLTNFKETP
jgi:hypothetical protein